MATFNYETEDYKLNIDASESAILGLVVIATMGYIAGKTLQPHHMVEKTPRLSKTEALGLEIKEEL